METINYAPLLPQEPPKDIVSWALEQGAMQQEYLIYKAGKEYVPLEDRWKQAVEVFCTDCGTRFTADKTAAGGCHAAYAPAPFGFWNPRTTEAVIEGSETMCPICGAQVKVKHVGSIPRGIEDLTFITTVHRIHVVGERDRLALIEWRTGRTIQKNGSIRFYSTPWTAWVVEENKIVRLMGYTRFMSSLRCHPLEQLKTFLDCYEKSVLVYPWDPATLEGTTAENCKLDRYIAQGGTRLISYLALWRRRPAVENLVMQGYGFLVDQLINAEQYHGAYERKKGIPKLPIINWKEKKPHRMLHMSRAEFRNSAHYLTGEKFELLVWARQNGLTVTLPEGLDALSALGSHNAERLLETTGTEEFWKAADYISRQKADVTTYVDYRKMAADLRMDIDNVQVRWPKNLKAAHDATVKRQQEQKDHILKEKFQKRLQELSKFSWECGDILIRPAATQAELRHEGRELCHCVATYAKSHAEGKTAIFFIRRKEAPDKPWYTLELDEKKLAVRQNRGKSNCGKTEEVQAFEDAWIGWLTLNKHQKKGGAAA